MFGGVLACILDNTVPGEQRFKENDPYSKKITLPWMLPTFSSGSTFKVKCFL